MNKQDYVIISLTTIHSRLDILPKTIESILNQSQLPDIIHIFYSNEPFMFDEGISDSEINKIAYDLQLINIDKIKIFFTNTENIGPYRKLIPALKLYKNHIIITIDDDHEYEQTFIKSYVDAYENYKCIICSGGRIIDLVNPEKSIEDTKITNIFNFPKYNVLPEGFGGILYHSTMFNDDFLNLSFKTLPEIVLKNDDILFRLYTLYKSIPVFYVYIDKTHLLDFDKHKSLYIDFNINSSISSTISKIKNFNYFNNFNISDIISYENEEEKQKDYNKLHNLFKEKISTGVDIKLLQYEINAKKRCNNIIELNNMINKNLSINTNNTNCIIINIYHDIKRYHLVIEELKKISINNFIHLKATYWKEKENHVKDLNMVFYFLRQFNDNIPCDLISMDIFSEMSDPNIYIQDGPLACWCSHVRSMIYGYLHFKEYTIIVEDDILIANTKNIEKYINIIPNDWDIICLNAGPINLKYNEPFYKFKDLFHSTHFYIVRNKCMPILFKNMYPIYDQVDILISKMNNQLNIYNIVETVYQKNFSTNTQNNLYVIWNSPNYECLRKHIYDLTDNLVRYINFKLPENNIAERLTSNILYNVIYNYIITQNSIDYYNPQINTNDTFIKLTNTYSEYQNIYDMVYLIINCSVKGINLNNTTLLLLDDIDNIINKFTLHNKMNNRYNELYKAYSYGSTSNTYLLEKNNKIIKIYNDKLRWTTKNHDNHIAIFYKECAIYNILYSNECNIDMNDLSIEMDYKGISLYDNFVLPENWKEQLINIFNKLSKNNIYYPEFNLKNIVIKNSVVSLIDFGLATQINNVDNSNNCEIFIELLEKINIKIKKNKTHNDNLITFTTFINNLKLNKQFLNNIF